MKNKNEFKTIYVNKISKNGAWFSYNFALKTCLICTNLLKKEASKKAKKKYADNNKEKVKETIKKYRKNNLEKEKNRSKKYKDNKSISQFLNYNKNELKSHLESKFKARMNWENYGIYNKKTWNDNEQKTWTWQIDHIISQCLLKYSFMEDENFKKSWALENLRPLSSKQNFLLGLKVKKNAM